MGQGPGPGSRRPRAEARAGPRRARGGADQPGRTRARLAQCELSATQSTSPRAVRAQRDIIRLRSIRASPPGAMRAQVTSPKRLPQGWGRANGAPDSGPHPDSPGKRNSGGRRADGRHDRTRPRTAVSGEKGSPNQRRGDRTIWETSGRTPNDCSRGYCRGVGITLSFRPRDAYCRRLSNRTRGLRSQKLRPPRRARRTRAPERRSRR